MKSNSRAVYYVSYTFAIIVLVIGSIAGVCLRTRYANIKENGISTVGTVIEQIVTRNENRHIGISVKFDFYVNDSILVVNRGYSGKYVRDAIIGMKYKVKYLPEDPHINSMIFIDEPIKSEYVNIEKEIERIRNTYQIK